MQLSDVNVSILFQSTEEMIRQTPERWILNAADAAVATLDIPADALRERSFEISCSMTVRPDADAAAPWHELKIYADGELQWSRRIPTAAAAEFDGLDCRFRRRVAVAHTLRLQAMAECGAGRRLSLLIEAEEC